MHMGAARHRLPLVLMYHSIAPCDEDPFLITVHPARFEQQMRWLRGRGLRGTSMRELLEARRRGRSAGLVGLTFDDGYADFAVHALPVLTRYRFTATVFVIAGRLGGDNGWEAEGPRKTLLTTDEIRGIAAAGMEIASHGLRHVKLSAASVTALAEEVARSREILRAITGEEIGGFCYPYGDLNARAVDAVRAAGYDYGCAVSLSEFLGQYALPRTYVGDRDASLRMAAKRLRHHLISQGHSGDLGGAF
ncbi:MAG: polysaccharide deacetylase family protein [Streptosporangiales bacterium]|nr:polysaccharide deacetylase family protein [Streptosporangiales bacterium]